MREAIKFLVTNDKVSHIVFSYFIVSVAARFIGITNGLLLAFVLGIVKEFWYDVSPDWKDLVANFVGIALAWYVMKGVH